MVKLSSESITQSDIERYLSDFSDFSFELQVLKKFVDLGFGCSHGGTYEDPVTSKSREYDIRALLQKGVIRVHLSVECKNFRDNSPLVVYCLKRKENESYNELIHSFDPYSDHRILFTQYKLRDDAYSDNIRVQRYSLYAKEQFVAKSVDQIEKRQDGEFTKSTDGKVFDKISQAINSAIDLISEANYLDTDTSHGGNNSPGYLTFVCPVLVIPDSSLWQAKYSDDGERIGEPERINHISYYIGKKWTVGNEPNLLHYTLSHLEIVTYSEIQNFVEKYLGDYITLCSAKIGGEFS